MKILVAGCGSIGKRHARNIKALGGHDLVLMDVNADVARDAGALIGAPHGADFDALLEQKPDAVFITTPPSLHVPMALKALAAGAHVFIEKPLSGSLDGVEDLAAQARVREKTVMVGCNMRFHPNLAFMKTFVKAGLLGKMYAVRAEVASYLPDWRPNADYRKNYAARRSEGGGVLLDSIHELDYITWIGGDLTEVKCVGARVSTLEIETEDCADVAFRFENGAIGGLHLDYLQHAYARTSKWVGERGTMTWDMNEGVVRFFDNASKTWTELHRLPTGYEMNTIYVDEIKMFFDSIRKGAVPMGGLDEAIRALKWTVRCQENAGLVPAGVA